MNSYKFKVGDEVVYWVEDIRDWGNFWADRNGTSAIIEKINGEINDVTLKFKDGKF